MQELLNNNPNGYLHVLFGLLGVVLDVVAAASTVGVGAIFTRLGGNNIFYLTEEKLRSIGFTRRFRHKKVRAWAGMSWHEWVQSDVSASHHLWVQEVLTISITAGRVLPQRFWGKKQVQVCKQDVNGHINISECKWMQGYIQAQWHDQVQVIAGVEVGTRAQAAAGVEMDSMAWVDTQYYV